MIDTEKKPEFHLVVLIVGLLVSLLFLVSASSSLSLTPVQQTALSYSAGLIFLLIVLSGMLFERMKISCLGIREQLVLNLLAISSLFCCEELLEPRPSGWIMLALLVVWLVMLGVPTIQSCISLLFKKKT